MSLVLTYSFIRSQGVQLQISANGSRVDWALQAAQTGASVALEHIQSTEWEGIDEVLAREVFSDAEGTADFEVVFNPVSLSEISGISVEAALMLKIESTGTWTSAEDSSQEVSTTATESTAPGTPLPRSGISMENMVAATLCTPGKIPAPSSPR